MLLALVRYFYSVTVQLQHSDLQIIDYKLHQLAFRQVQKLQSGSPERESEQGQGEEWKELASGLEHPWSPSSGSAAPSRLCCSSAPPPARSWRDIGGENRSRRFFPARGCKYQHREQSSGNFQSSSPLFCHFLMHQLQTLRKSAISLYYTHGVGGRNEGDLEIWVGKCIEVVTQEVLLVQSSGSHILLLDDIKGFEILKLSLKYH